MTSKTYQPAFFLTYLRDWWIRTTNNTDVRKLGAVFLVNDQSSLLISLNSNILKSKTVGVWSSSDGNENNVGVQSLFLAALCGFGADGDGGSAGVALGDLGVGQELDSLYVKIVLAVLRGRETGRVDIPAWQESSGQPWRSQSPFRDHRSGPRIRQR